MTKELNGRLKELVDLAARPPAKNVKELSKMVSLMAVVLIEIHLEMRNVAGPKETPLQMILTRVVAPLAVGIGLWLFLDLGPAIIRSINIP